MYKFCNRIVAIFLFLFVVSCGGGNSGMAENTNFSRPDISDSNESLISQESRLVFNEDDLDRITALMEAASEHYFLTGVYLYPVTPSMDEWQLLTAAGFVFVSTIPDNILIELSNSQLLDLSLTHPLHPSMLAFEHFYVYIERFSGFANALSYLLTLPDAPEFLLNEYLATPVDPIVETEKLGGDDWKNAFLEALLSREDMLTPLSANELFLTNFSEKFSYKVEHHILDDNSEPSVYSYYLVQAAAMVAAPLLKDAGILSNIDGNGDVLPRYSMFATQEVVDLLTRDDGTLYVSYFYRYLAGLTDDYVRTL